MGSDESAADTLMEDLKSSSLGSVCVEEEGQILSWRCVLWLALPSIRSLLKTVVLERRRIQGGSTSKKALLGLWSYFLHLSSSGNRKESEYEPCLSWSRDCAK